MTSHSRCAKDSASCDTNSVFFANIGRTSGVGGRVVDEFRSCLSKPEGSVCHFRLSMFYYIFGFHY